MALRLSCLPVVQRAQGMPFFFFFEPVLGWAFHGCNCPWSSMLLLSNINNSLDGRARLGRDHVVFFKSSVLCVEWVHIPYTGKSHGSLDLYLRTERDIHSASWKLFFKVPKVWLYGKSTLIAKTWFSNKPIRCRQCTLSSHYSCWLVIKDGLKDGLCYWAELLIWWLHVSRSLL